MSVDLYISTGLDGTSALCMRTICRRAKVWGELGTSLIKCRILWTSPQTWTKTKRFKPVELLINNNNNNNIIIIILIIIILIIITLHFVIIVEPSVLSRLPNYFELKLVSLVDLFPSLLVPISNNFVCFSVGV